MPKAACREGWGLLPLQPREAHHFADAVIVSARLVSGLLLLSTLMATGLAACSSRRPTETESLTMQVMGRDIVVPVPPRMKRWKVEASGLKHLFEPSTPRLKAPYYAQAMIRGAREEIANQVYQEARAGDLGPTEGVALLEWRGFLRDALAGKLGPLPDAPEGFLLIEHDTASAGTVIDLVHSRHGDDRTLIGAATLLVNARAISLDIVLKQPVDAAELVAVRTQIHDWASAVRAANP